MSNTKERFIPNNTNNKMTRKSNFELLRILAMLLIIASHWGWLSLKIDINSLSKSRYTFYVLFRSCGQVGVVLFVLISGYFMCTKKFNIMSLVKLFMQIVFLNLTALFIHFLFSKTITGYSFDFQKSTLLNIFLPFQGGYWFVYAYSFLFLLSPLLNIAISKLNGKQFIYILIILIFFASINQSFFGGSYIIMTFILLYTIASFIRLYPQYFVIKKLHLFIIITCLGFIYAKATTRGISPSIQENNNIILICMCTFIFLWFSKLNLGTNKIINLISGTTFGVYILHSCMFFGTRLWFDVLKQHIFITSKFFFIHAILSVLIVFITCALIDLFRKYIFEKPIDKFITKLFGNVINSINLTFPKLEVSIHENQPANYTFLLILLQTITSYIISKVIFNRFLKFTNLISYAIFIVLNLLIIIIVYTLRHLKFNKLKNLQKQTKKEQS